MAENIINDLGKELVDLEGIHGQHPESGAGINSGNSYIDKYTNKVFGAPYQLLDSVDRRFPDINSHVGNEYLRNILLDSPILHIKPGLPKYTGGTDATSISQGVKDIYMDVTQGDMSFASSLLDQLATSTIFGGGSKLQKRMFGFRECYYDYMQHVNYMCRSMATFLNLTKGAELPSGAFTANGTFEEFATFKWENYRMMADSRVLKPSEYLVEIGESGIVADIKATGHTASGIGKLFLSGVLGLTDVATGGNIDGLGDISSEVMSGGLNEISEAWKFAANTSMSDSLVDKICSVEFMVEPTSFTETLVNDTAPSTIENLIDGISSDLGAEIAFITNSNADLGMIEGVADLLGSTLDSAVTMLGGLVQTTAGGFTGNLFNGAFNSIKGQKMIYPEIYKKSNSQMDYNFSITLTSPYGDIYNYFMNIIVPLMHLIALAAPRMVTANTTTSPYMIQAYIPGMCTCHLGIISQMNIQKNPTGKHVSVHGFPLTVKVDFTIKELYNAMSISPGNDPSSFLFNETLNDYMSNLAGLAPSVDTYVQQRENAFKNLNEYIASGTYVEDVINATTTKIEDMYNPFTGR